MADVTISIGSLKMANTPRVPVTLKLFPMSDFNLADGTPITASSPYSGGNAYKSIPLTPTGTDPTVYAWAAFTVPATEDADVNPNGARWGLFAFDGSSTPRIITHVSGLSSFRVPVAPTPTTVEALALYNGGSLAPVVVNVSVSGTLTVAGLATFDDVVIGGTLNGQGIIGGAGVVDRLPYWTDSDTLGSSPLIRLDSETTEHRGSGGATKFCVSAGYVDATDFARAAIYATTAVVSYGVERDGSATEIPVRLSSFGGGDIQFGTEGTVWWDFIAGFFLPRLDTYGIGSNSRPISKLWVKGAVQWVNTSIEQVSLDSEDIDSLSLIDSVGTYTARFKYGDEIYLQAIAASPEGVVTASPGSLVSAETGAVYKKASGVGNTGWEALLSSDATGKVSGSGVKVYRALLTQDASDAPVATVRENSLGGTVVWTRTGAGEYVGTLTGAFLAAKYFIARPSNSYAVAGELASVTLLRGSDDTVLMKVQKTDVTIPETVYADGYLVECSVEILTYP